MSGGWAGERAGTAHRKRSSALSQTGSERTLVIINAYAGEAARLTDFVEFASVYAPLAAYFRKVELLVPVQVGTPPQVPSNLTLHRLPGGLAGFPSFIHAASRMATNLARGGPTTIWAQDPIVCGVSGLIAARRAGAHFVVDLHNDFWSERDRGRPLARVHGLIARAVARRADRVCAVSDRIARHSRLSGVTVIPSPVRLDLFHSGVAPDSRLIAGGTAPVVVPAALIRRKGHRLLLHALALLRDRADLPRFAFVGDGPEAGPLARLVRSLDLEERVVLAGQRSHAEMPGVYAAARFMVLPSLDEGAPRAVAEAMAMRRLVVATPASGALVRDGETGILSPPEPAALAEAIERALTLTPTQRETLLDAAEGLVHRELSPDVAIGRMLEQLVP